MSAAKKHTVVFEWSGEGPEASILCPWDQDDPERDCKILDSWSECSEPDVLKGCALREWLDGGGYESISIESPIVSEPVPVEIVWKNDGEYPALRCSAGQP